MKGCPFSGQVSLELGGKSPNIVFESADLEQGGSLEPVPSDSKLSLLTLHHFAAQRLLGQPWESCTIQVRVFGAGRFQNNGPTVSMLASGEDCTAGSRVYVQDSVYDKFVDLLIDRVKSTPIGDGFDETVTSGPIVSGCSVGVLTVIYG